MIAAITITLGWWLIPTILTLIIGGFAISLLIKAINGGDGGFFGGVAEFVLSIFLLTPIFAIWMVYFAARLIFS